MIHSVNGDGLAQRSLFKLICALVLASHAALVSGCGPQTTESTSRYLGTVRDPDGLVIPGTIVHAKVSYGESTTVCVSEPFDGENPDCSSDRFSEPVAIEALQCDAPGCKVTKLAPDEYQVESDRAGVVTVSVTARPDSAGDSVTDSSTYAFSDVHRLDIFRMRGRGHGANLPVIVGTELLWCASALGIGAKGETGMHIAPGAATFVTDGTFLTGTSTTTVLYPRDGLIGCIPIRAARPGMGSVTVHFAGSERVIAVEVVDPSRVVSVNAHDLFPIDGTSWPDHNSDEIPVLDASMEPCGTSSIHFGVNSAWIYYGHPYAFGMVLEDGRTAVGAASEVSWEPYGSVLVRSMGYQATSDSTVAAGTFVVSAGVPLTGGIKLKVGNTSFALNVSVDATNICHAICDDSR